MSKVIGLFSLGRKFLWQNKLIAVFISTHVLFAIFLGRLFALAPDEGGYLYTFNNLYGSKDANPQYQSGWITAPKPFLWITYLPAKVMNLSGVPDYLSIRFLSIFLAAVSLILLKNLHDRSVIHGKGFDNVIFLFFFIPSIFLWTSVGLRESFILAELALIFVGVGYLFENRNKRAFLFIFLGSYGLLSTKSYLWICLVASAILLSIFLAIQRKYRKKTTNLLAALILLPCLFFASTTSWYALEFIFASVFTTDVSAVGDRSGDSILQIAIPIETTAPTSPTVPAFGCWYCTSMVPTVPTSPPVPTVLVTFRGDTTLILLHFYLVDNPQAPFTRVLTALGITERVQTIWDQKVESGLVKKSKEAVRESSSLSGYILKPGDISNPLSNIRPALLFLLGPFPFLDQGGIALNIVSLESPLWWALYLLVIFQFIRFRKVKYWQDPPALLALTCFMAFLAFSALVEVNLGTSFRHRSILLVPLIFLYVRIRAISDQKRSDFSVSRQL